MAAASSAEVAREDAGSPEQEAEREQARQREQQQARGGATGARRGRGAGFTKNPLNHAARRSPRGGPPLVRYTSSPRTPLNERSTSVPVLP